jgi:hypothetical protein
VKGVVPVQLPLVTVRTCASTKAPVIAGGFSLTGGMRGATRAVAAERLVPSPSTFVAVTETRMTLPRSAEVRT